MKDGKSSLKKFAVVLNVAIFCLLILAGCATKEAVKNVSDEDILRERVTAYWNYRIKGDMDKAYSYEDLYTKNMVSMSKYIAGGMNPLVQWSGFELVEIKMKNADTAAVKIKANLKIKAPGAKAFEHDMMMVDQWVRDEGYWYHLSNFNSKPIGKK